MKRCFIPLIIMVFFIGCGQKEKDFAEIPDGLPDIIFISIRDADMSNRNFNAQKELYIMSNEKVSRITHNEYWENFPTLSPDGKKILVGIHASPIQGTRESDSGWEIALMDIDGSHLEFLTNNSYLDNTPHWAPDGTHIIFVSDASKGELAKLDLYEMDITDKSTTKLTNASKGVVFADATISPDGTKIAYVSNTIRHENHFEVFIMDRDGKNPERIVSIDDIPDAIQLNDPTWGPDSKKIVFEAKTGEGNGGWGIFDLYTVDYGGDNLERLTLDEGDADIIGWFSPDGNYVVYQEFNESRSRIGLIKVSDSKNIYLTGNIPNYMDSKPSWVTPVD